MIDQLIALCRNNENFFHDDFIQLYSRDIADGLEKSVPILKEIESFASEYDFDEKTPGNGFRSFLIVFNSAVVYIQRVCNDIKDKREKFFFRRILHEK